MGIVRRITRPITRVPVSYSTGVSDAARIDLNSDVAPDYSDLTSMFVGRDGSGGNTAPSGVVGLQLDKSHMGGMTAAAYIDSRVEYNSGDDEWTVGTGWALSDGVFTATSVGNTAGNHSVIDAPPTGAGFVKVTLDVTRTSGTLLVKYYKSGTFHGASISSTGSYEFLLNGSLSGAGGVTTYGVTLSGDPAFTGTVSNISIKHIPGQHRTAAADNERPVLDLTNGVYSLDYDGVDDGLSFDFEGGAGPADCSVFYAENTGSGWVLAEDQNQDYSGVASLSMADIVGATPNGKYIGPIIVETSKLTNSLRRSIETYLKRKAGIQ